jgi:prepilin signal peptidase PulO-like enzyme (type II secretory pathway)
MPASEIIAVVGLVAVLGVLTIIDFRHSILPNRIVLPGTVVAAAAAPWLPADGYLSGLVGALTAFALFAVIYFFRPGVIGGGDVKLAALIGFALGFPAALQALMLAPALMLAVAVPMLLLRRWSLRQRVPYGPYMAAGATALALLSL